MAAQIGFIPGRADHADFFALFPRPLFRRSWPLLAVWLPALTWVPGYLIYFFNLVYRPAQAFGHEILAIRPVRILGLYFLASLLALIFNYFQLKDLNERRRLRVLLVGEPSEFSPVS